MELDGMPGPVATPIVVQVDLHSLIPLIDAIGEKVLDTGIFGKGNVRTLVKDEVGVVAERCRVAAIVTVPVVHYGRDARTVQSVSGTEPSHPSSKDDNVWHLRELSPDPPGLRERARAAV